MNGLLVLLMLWAATAFAQSPFDGTWMIDSDSMTVAEKPSVYLVAKGMIRGVGCAGNVEIKADGDDQKIPKGSYRDTANARIVDANTIEIICKKAGKTMFTETDTVSPDGNMLTQMVKDTTEAEAVTIETFSRRVEKGARWSARCFRILARIQGEVLQEQFHHQIQVHSGWIQRGNSAWRKIRREV
jgi:hypothetical protein